MPQNSQKHAKYHEIWKKSYQIHVCTALSLSLSLSQLLGLYLLAVNFKHPKTSRRRLCYEKLGISHDVKGFAIGSFLEHFVVERAK